MKPMTTMGALRNYTGPGYEKVNDALRKSPASPDAGSGPTTRPSVNQQVGKINKGIAKLAEGNKEPQVTFRGVGRNAPAPQEGKTYSDPAFMSTSKADTTNAAGVVRNFGRNGTTMAVVGNKGGDLGGISQFGNEREVLYPNGQKFNTRFAADVSPEAKAIANKNQFTPGKKPVVGNTTQRVAVLEQQNSLPQKTPQEYRAGQSTPDLAPNKNPGERTGAQGSYRPSPLPKANGTEKATPTQPKVEPTAKPKPVDINTLDPKVVAHADAKPADKPVDKPTAKPGDMKPPKSPFDLQPSASSGAPPKSPFETSPSSSSQLSPAPSKAGSTSNGGAPKSPFETSPSSSSQLSPAPSKAGSTSNGGAPKSPFETHQSTPSQLSPAPSKAGSTSAPAQGAGSSATPSGSAKPADTSAPAKTPTQHDYQDVYMDNRNKNMNADQARDASNKKFLEQNPKVDTQQLNKFAAESEAKKQADDAKVNQAQKDFEREVSDERGKGKSTEDAIKQADADAAKKNPDVSAEWRQKFAQGARDSSTVADAADAAVASARGSGASESAAAEAGTEAAAQAASRIGGAAGKALGAVGKALGPAGAIVGYGVGIGMDAKALVDANHSGDQGKITEARNTLIGDVFTGGMYSLFKGLVDAAKNTHTPTDQDRQDQQQAMSFME